MVETDLLYAFIMQRGLVETSCGKHHFENQKRRILYSLRFTRELTRDLLCVKEVGISLDEVIARVAALTSIENLVFLDTAYEIDLLALALMRQYNLGSIFDAYYAATVLN
jgi:predicted nucleic acid-binding protein